MRESICLLTAILLVLCVCGLVGVAPAAAEPAEPEVAIVTPPTGATISGNRVEIAVSFSSSEAKPVSKVQVFLDGKYVTERAFEAALPQGVCSFKWDTVRTPDGLHKLDIQILSNDNYLGMASCTVTVMNRAPDLEPPRVAIMSPREGEVVSDITPITIETSDNAGGEPFVSIYVDRSLRSVKNRGPYAYEWDTSSDENGPHTIEATAVDAAGNKADAKPVRVIIRNPVQQEPVTIRPLAEISAVRNATQPSEDIPASPGFPTSTATPTETGAQSGTESTEFARAVPEQGAAAAESFEVGQTAVAGANQSPSRDQGPPGVRVPASAHDAVPDASAAAAEPPKTDSARTVAKAESKPTPIPTPASTEVEKTADSSACAHSADGAYVVRPGDCIDRLARKFGVSASAIVALNSIQNPNLIKIGEKLLIPAAVTMIPIRPAFEEAGGTLTWYAEERRVHAVSPQNDVTLRIGSADALVNSEHVTMAGATTIESGRTLVPESFVTQTLCMDVSGS